MRYRPVLLTFAFVATLLACKKENRDDSPTPPTEPQVEKKVLLKDITIPHLPSPYYHFEYSPDSLCTKANFASGYTIYDVFHEGNKITEMRNNILVNHDTLRYFYDNAGKLTFIKFINQSNVNYRQVKFTYDGSQISEIEWDYKSGASDFFIDRKLTFGFYPDGNVRTIVNHRYPHSGLPENTTLTEFEGYDNKINVDDFSLLHDGIHDHLFLLQGFRVQRNNPFKETLTADGVKLYVVDYTYDYTVDGTPTAKKGNLLFTSGADAGKRFQTNSFYTYY